MEHAIGLCLVSKSPALKADVTFVVDKLNELLGSDAPNTLT